MNEEIEDEYTISEKETLSTLNVLMLFLSVYVLIVLLIETFFPLPQEIQKVLELVDNLVCMIFLYDFGVRFFKAKNKIYFMKWGWIDLVSSIPSFDFLRLGRLLRLIRLFRILRAFRSVKHIAAHVYKSKSTGAFTTVLVISILSIIFSSISILEFETAANSNIKSAEDALWWAFSTISTVGYGDKFPVTTGGRIIGVILMIVGGGLFATMSGFFASWFVGENKKEAN
jgi:voltage-gated potassium channel